MANLMMEAELVVAEAYMILDCRNERDQQRETM
jgi:hypothetical protein